LVIRTRRISQLPMVGRGSIVTVEDRAAAAGSNLPWSWSQTRSRSTPPPTQQSGRATGTGGGEHAKQPRLAADQPLQGGRGGWQLPTETHWRSQPGGAWGGYRAATRQSGSDVQPVGT
jgi:hypothetical protein